MSKADEKPLNNMEKDWDNPYDERWNEAGSAETKGVSGEMSGKKWFLVEATEKNSQWLNHQWLKREGTEITPDYEDEIVEKLKDYKGSEIVVREVFRQLRGDKE